MNELILYYRLILQATDKGNPPLSSTTTVRVQVVDINDNSPVIPPMETVFIAESELKLIPTPALQAFEMTKSNYNNNFSIRFKMELCSPLITK